MNKILIKNPSTVRDLFNSTQSVNYFDKVYLDVNGILTKISEIRKELTTDGQILIIQVDEENLIF